MPAGPPKCPEPTEDDRAQFGDGQFTPSPIPRTREMIHNPPIHPQFRSLASTRPGGRQQHRSHEPPPSHEKEPAPYTIARGTRRHARRVPRQPGQEPARGAGDPTGCSSGTIKVANDIPVGRPNNCDGAVVLYCNPAADTEGRVILPDRSPEQPKQHRTPRRAGRLLNPTPDAVDRGCHRHRHRRWRCTYPPEWLGTATWAGTGRMGFGSRGPAAPGATAAAGGVGYFSCSRAAVRKMAPRRWVNSAWVVTSVVNQSSWLPSASFFSASTTDSSAAW